MLVECLSVYLLKIKEVFLDGFMGHNSVILLPAIAAIFPVGILYAVQTDQGLKHHKQLNWNDQLQLCSAKCRY